MADETAPGKKTATLQFHYIKGPLYREVACHGLVGGVTPNQRIWLAMYTERGSIPRTVEFEVEADEGAEKVQFEEGQAKPSRIDTRMGIVRHIEFGTYLDIETAERIHKWLGDRLEEVKNAR